ncbi:hypothetical protein D3C87_1593000 [compost metagenome]
MLLLRDHRLLQVYRHHLIQHLHLIHLHHHWLNQFQQHPRRYYRQLYHLQLKQ